MSHFIQDALFIFNAAVSGVQAQTLMERMEVEALLGSSLAKFQRVVVVGTGKASMAMAGALESWLGRAVDEGLVVVPHGYRRTLPATAPRPSRIEVVEAGHPVPDQAGMEAARRVMDLATGAGENDLLIVLLSGGGSALWPAFAEPITMQEAQKVFRLLLHSGADINETNTVRKHLSSISGGRLAALAAPATVRALVLSDVVADKLSVIASGPTVPDSTTFADAVTVLQTYQLWNSIPASVRNLLEAGLHGIIEESPKPESAAFDYARTEMLGSNRDALAAAQRTAVSLGYDTQIVSNEVRGVAREVGQHLARQALTIDNSRSRCLLWGGETTVSVTGRGKGGRNQEVALGAALALDGSHRDIVILSGGTDGIDGPTDAAGAWATPQTVSQARMLGLNPKQVLTENNAYPFFEQLGALVKPGPTHTNVMDVQIALISC